MFPPNGTSQKKVGKDKRFPVGNTALSKLLILLPYAWV
jgi:hypothetical protein